MYFVKGVKPSFTKYTLSHLIFRISNDKRPDTQMGIWSFGDPPEIRTPDTLLKRQVLCLLSYWGMSLIFGWDGGTRTHYIRVKV